MNNLKKIDDLIKIKCLSTVFRAGHEFELFKAG